MNVVASLALSLTCIVPLICQTNEGVTWKCAAGARESRIDLAQVKMSKWVSSQWDLSWRTRNHPEVNLIQPVVKVTGNLKRRFLTAGMLWTTRRLGQTGAGTQKEPRGEPGLDEHRRDYGSRNVFSQPHHAGAYKLAPVESQRPACGVLEQLKPPVSGSLQP